MKKSRYSLVLRLLLALVAAAGLAYWGGAAHDRLALELHRDQHAYRPFVLDGDTGRILSSTAASQAAGLTAGTRITSLDGIPYSGLVQFYDLVDPAQPGEHISVGFIVRKGNVEGAARTADLTLGPIPAIPGVPTTGGAIFQQFFLYNLVPLACMLIGFWVVFVKVDELNAWLMLVLLLYPSTIFAEVIGLSTHGWFIIRYAWEQIIQYLVPPALLLFAIYFPERSRRDVRWHWLKWAVLVPSAACIAIDLRQMCGWLFLGGNAPWFAHLVRLSDRVLIGLDYACIALYIVLLLDKLRTAAGADTRRRLRVLLSGTAIGIGALLLFFVLLPAIGFSLYTGTRGWLLYPGVILFMFAPLTLAYVVLVQRAMDVRVLVRQGTRYALASATLWVIQIGLMIFLISNQVVPLFSDRNRTPYRTLHIVVYIALIFVVRRLFRKTRGNWLDKKFFREAYDSELILSELAEEVRQYTESGPLLQTVSRRVAATLHVRPVAMLLRSGADFQLVQATGLAAEIEHQPLELSGISSIVRKLNNDRIPARLYRDDPDAWYMLAGRSERETLDLLRAELLLPLFGRARLMGVMCLGPKQSEAAYTQTDLRLLQALAMQTGMALEVGELAHSLAREAAQRERAMQELDLAREVQERLFPQQMPVVPGITIAGACRPAQVVGGDYYDVFTLADGRVCLALGDISGKGISAALLMASLRASMRSIAFELAHDPGQLIGRINRLIFEASASNRFATLFFAVYDPTTCVLECVNAGHNPPLLLRRQNGNGNGAAGGDGGHAAPEVQELEADGPVIGLLDGLAYCAKRYNLVPGDTLVTFTDGISEAMTHDDEEWGDERLLAAALAAGDDSAEQMLQAIFKDADAFTAGAKQHDDMTVLVLKLDKGCAVTQA